ncbi:MULTISPECIES: hypothetical protein [Pacificimonas]|nr:MULTISPECIES: hypothetical protein [Pacificimonas]MBZ6377348.1 hypothetical protein [Pacificimonas aurantium]
MSLYRLPSTLDSLTAYALAHRRPLSLSFLPDAEGHFLIQVTLGDQQCSLSFVKGSDRVHAIGQMAGDMLSLARSTDRVPDRSGGGYPDW